MRLYLAIRRCGCVQCLPLGYLARLHAEHVQAVVLATGGAANNVEVASKNDGVFSPALCAR